MQYINRIQQIHLQQQAVQIQGIPSAQPQVAQAQQQAGQQVQTQAGQQVQVSETQQQQPTSQNITPSTSTPQPHAEYASYGGQVC